LKTASDVVSVLDRALKETGADNLRFLCDLYHLAVNGDDVDAAIVGYADRVGHVQIADAPGRNEPGTGKLPLDRWLDALAQAGYVGWVALEYKPSGATMDSFGWLPEPARRAGR
jgi:hydroxypyruvate isomerase